MDKSKKFLELAERCEKAEGPDRELDARIHYEMMGLSTVYSIDDFLVSDISKNHPKRYTASLDAALTLVPEGWWVQHLGKITTGWWCRLGIEGRSLMYVAKTPALALCAAALRARAALEEHTKEN